MVDKIHVAIIRRDLSDDYNRHTATTMVSAMEHCSVPIVFHLFHEEILSLQNIPKANENIQKYRDLVSKYSSSVEFHNVVLDDWLTEGNIPAIKNYTSVGFYRFYFPALLPDLEKVISLGSDVVVKTDLLNLYQIDIETYYLAGVRDQDIDIWRQSFKNSHEAIFSLDRYVNADVLIFNLKKIRENDMLPERALSLLAVRPDFPLMEQDVFNKLFHGGILLLPKQYNIFVTKGDDWVDSILSTLSQENRNIGYILHWASHPKPWDFQTKSKYDMEYWSYLSKTPWGENWNIINYIPTSTEIIQNLDAYVWRYPLKQQIDVIFLLLTRLFKRYINRFIVSYMKYKYRLILRLPIIKHHQKRTMVKPEFSKEPRLRSSEKDLI